MVSRLLLSRRYSTPLAALLPLFLMACQGAAPAIDKPTTLVRVQTVAIVDYAPDIVINGEVLARNEVPLSFQSSGQLIAVQVDTGDHVEAGAVLARLEPKVQQANVSAAQAGVLAAKAAVGQANADFTRQNALFDQGLVTRSLFEQAQTTVQTAAAALDVANAQLATAREALRQTILTASVAGIITERNLSAGEIAQAGQPVFTLAADGPRDAVFNVQEAVFLAQPPGEHGVIESVDNPTVTATGTIRSVSPVLDAKTGTVQVTVSIADPTGDLPLGSAVIATVKARAFPAVILPWSALWSDAGKPAVWTVDPADSSVALTPVGIGAYVTGSVIIASGLEPGKVVVVEGAKLLHPGQIVSTTAEASK